MKKRITAILLAVTMVLASGCGKEAANTTTDQGPAQSANTSGQKNINYSMDPAETTLTELDKEAIMKDFEFAKSDDYVTNEELRKYIGDDSIASFANTAASHMSLIYNVDCNAIADEKEDYKELLKKVMSDNCVIGDGGDTFTDKWIQAVEDAGAVIEANFTTGKEFVYADDAEIYVRGVLNLTVKSATDASKLYEFMPVDVEVGKTYNFVYDVGYLAMVEDEGEEIADNGKIDYILAVAAY